MIPPNNWNYNGAGLIVNMACIEHYKVTVTIDTDTLTGTVVGADQRPQKIKNTSAAVRRGVAETRVSGGRRNAFFLQSIQRGLNKIRIPHHLQQSNKILTCTPQH